MSGPTYTHTHTYANTYTYTHDNYFNPRCAHAHRGFIIRNEILNEIDSLFARFPSSDPAVLVGDLNCHLGHLGGSRSDEDPNQRGVLWKDMLDRHSLFTASLGALSSGPIHTYSSGGHSTTLDYVIGNAALAELLQSCKTLDDDP